MGLAFYGFTRKYGRPTSLVVISCLSVCIAALIPICRNIELGNNNIWVAGFVGLHLLSFGFSGNKWTDFLGGAALGIAFMIKPYLLLVLVFIGYQSWLFLDAEGTVTGDETTLLIQHQDAKTT